MEPSEKAARITAAVRRECSKDCPIIVGPWTGEVGYELLYWIPFVRWALALCDVPPARVIVVSRGGTASWYSGLCFGRYVDAFDVISPSELAALGGAKPKQSAWGDDGGTELVDRVKRACGIDEVVQLTPHWMYRLYRAYWDGDAPIEFVDEHAIWSRVAPPALPEIETRVPPGSIAVRFYFSRSLPDTGTTRTFARTLIERLATQRPVVLLNHPFAIDDHSDLDTLGESVTSVADLMTPATNLTVQTAVIGRADAFVGTYGGLSLLPPLCGIPSYAFCSVPFMKPAHEQAIARMIERTGGAALLVDKPSDGTRAAEAVLAGIDT